MANSKRKCAFCKERKRTEDGIVKGLSFFCDIECMVGYGMKNKHKPVEAKAKAQKKIDREKLLKLKPVSDYVKEAQAAVNKYIRLRDRNKPCVSCGSFPSQVRGGTFDAGHYRSRGSASHLRFNLLNIHKQCVKCNRFNSGNAVDYRIELIKRIGQDNVDKLESDNESRKFTIGYLQRVKKIFNKRARFYEKRN